MSDPIDVPIRRAADGEPTTLRDALGGQPALVVLLRHLDCPFCEVHVGRVLRERDHLGRVILVGNATPTELMEQHADLPSEVVLLADERQALYEAFRTRRLRSALGLRIGPRSVATFIGHFLRGGRLQRPGQDLLQLGGDVVLESDGRTAWVRTSRRPDDRPTPEHIAEQLHRAA